VDRMNSFVPDRWCNSISIDALESNALNSPLPASQSHATSIGRSFAIRMKTQVTRGDGTRLVGALRGARQCNAEAQDGGISRTEPAGTCAIPGDPRGALLPGPWGIVAHAKVSLASCDLDRRRQVHLGGMRPVVDSSISRQAAAILRNSICTEFRRSGRNPPSAAIVLQCRDHTGQPHLR
jgi:hypothetical protein